MAKSHDEIANRIYERLGDRMSNFEWHVKKFVVKGNPQFKIYIVGGNVKAFTKATKVKLHSTTGYKTKTLFTDEIKAVIARTYAIALDTIQSAGYSKDTRVDVLIGDKHDNTTTAYKYVEKEGGYRGKSKGGSYGGRRKTITEEEKGTMLKDCGTWAIYTKELETKRGKSVVFSAYKKPETPRVETDWQLIKGEILTETGFKWSRFGAFQKWGLFSSMKERDEIFDKLCSILEKYYGKGEEKKEEKEKSEYRVSYGDVNQDLEHYVHTKKKVRFKDEAGIVKHVVVKDFDLKKDLDSGRYTVKIWSDEEKPFELVFYKDKDFHYLEYVGDDVLKGALITDLTETEKKSQSKEDIEKAIKGLQILADKGNEKAKKAIVGLRYLLDK